MDTPLRLAWTFSDSETSTRVFDTVPTHADLALKDKHFTITAQRYLGTPLAAFLAIEGQPHHGGRRDQPREVDRNGFNAGAVANGPQTHRHHDLRDAVCKLLLWAGATIAPESRNLFSRYFSQEATADTPNHNRSDNTPRQARRRQGRDQRAPLQGCRPDIHFRMTGDTDNLAEILAVLSHYPINGSNLLRNSRPAAAFPRGDPRHPEHQPPVEARAATCHAEYETSLRTAAERSSPGDSAEAVTEAQARAQRAIQHLNDTYGQVIPLVAGAWGELNGAFKQLLRHIVERQVGGRSGGTDGVRSVAWQHVRRHISIAVAKANAECLCKVLDNSGDHIDPDAAAQASASRQQDLQRIYSDGHAAQEAYRMHYDYSHDFPNGPPRG